MLGWSTLTIPHCSIGACILFCACAIPAVISQVSAALRVAAGERGSVVGSGHYLSGTLDWRLMCG